MQDGVSKIVAVKVRIAKIIIQPGIVDPDSNELFIPSNGLLVIALGILGRRTYEGLLKSPIGLLQLYELLGVGEGVRDCRGLAHSATASHAIM